MATLVDQCQKVSINSFVSTVLPKLKRQLLETQISVDGFNLELCTTETSLGGTRFWFKCPLCNLRKGVLYQHPTSGLLGCRTCLALDYRSRRYSKMIENSI